MMRKVVILIKIAKAMWNIGQENRRNISNNFIAGGKKPDQIAAVSQHTTFL